VLKCDLFHSSLMLFIIFQSKWKESTPKQLVWQKKSFAREARLRDGINFVKLSNTLLNGGVVNFLSAIQTQSYCKLSATKTYVETIACACLDLQGEKQDTCFDVLSPTIGAASLCPSINDQISVLHRILTCRESVCLPLFS